MTGGWARSGRPRLALAAAAALAAGCASPGAVGRPAASGAADEPAARDFGVEVLGVRSVAANHILDFRFRVRDPERAAPLLSRGIAPLLVDEESGRKLEVPVSPKIGPLRTTTARPEEGRTYFVLFRNPGGAIPVGRRVNVVIGEFQARNLVVE